MQKLDYLVVILDLIISSSKIAMRKYFFKRILADIGEFCVDCSLIL